MTPPSTNATASARRARRSTPRGSRCSSAARNPRSLGANRSRSRPTWRSSTAEIGGVEGVYANGTPGMELRIAETLTVSQSFPS